MGDGVGAKRQGREPTNHRGAANFAIRPAGLDDLDEIFALECASFSADRLSRRALRRFLKSSHRPLLAARLGGRLAGYILVVMTSRSSAARIYSLAVDAAFARRGVGRELLRAGERYALAQGRRSMRLEARYDNAAALALYESQGYEDFGRYPEYYADGAEALRLEKRIAPFEFGD
jgi:ribosomal-protein-alanine N-acetyltransferase